MNTTLSETEVRHVRTRGEMRKDKRFRAAYPRITNRNGTLCGAAPTRYDIDKGTMAHYEKFRAIKPEWSADVCPSCRELAKEEDK